MISRYKKTNALLRNYRLKKLFLYRIFIYIYITINKINPLAFLADDGEEATRTDRPVNEEDEEGQHRIKDEDGSVSPSSSSVNDDEGAPPTLVPSALNKIFNANDLSHRGKAASRKTGRLSNGAYRNLSQRSAQLHDQNEEDDQEER